MENDGYLKGIDFSHVPAKYWSDVTKMNYVQRRVIVASIQYYVIGEGIIPDAVYDGISHQLVQMMEEYSEETCKRSQYWYCMHDFDGSTGFDLYSRLNKRDKDYLMKIAEHVMAAYKIKGKEDSKKESGKDARTKKRKR